MIKNTHKKKNRLFHKWHRNTGVAILLIVVILSITGIALNHNDDFLFNKKYVTSNWILDFYGIHTPKNIATYSSGKNWVYQIDSRLYFNNATIQHDNGALISAVQFSGMNIIALEDDIFLMNNDAELIDQLSDSIELPGTIQAMTVIDNNLIIKTNESIWMTDNDFLEWQPTNLKNISWKTSQTPPSQITTQIHSNYRGTGLSYERILLDLHSGRVFGKMGVLLWDLAAIGLLLMSFSGAWMWMRPKNRNKQKSNNTSEALARE